MTPGVQNPDNVQHDPKSTESRDGSLKDSSMTPLSTESRDGSLTLETVAWPLEYKIFEKKHVAQVWEHGLCILCLKIPNMHVSEDGEHGLCIFMLLPGTQNSKMGS